MSGKTELGPGLKLAVEAGPLVLFFISNAYAGIFWATGIFMAASLAAFGFSYLRTGRLAVVPVIGVVLVAVFGALTLCLRDDLFIKIKVTLINGLFGTALLAGLILDRPLLKHVLGESISLDDEGWRKLTLRWVVFFFAVALLNEFVWRSFSTAAWVNFKVFGLLPLTFAFALAQLPLMQRHSRDAS